MNCSHDPCDPSLGSLEDISPAQIYRSDLTSVVFFLLSFIAIYSLNVTYFLPGYNLAQSDHPGNVKRGDVCLYCKEKFSLRMINVSFLSQCVLCEVTLQRQKGYVIVIYRSPSQTAVEFDEFLSNLEKLLNFVKQSQPSFTIILGDFNARSKSWWPDDITSPEGTDIDSLTTVHGLQQLISEPTHLLPNSLSCIDLIFTDQPNLVVDSGVHPSLHPNCHQIIFCKFNLMIEYPPPYERLVWDYKHSDEKAIANALDQVDWSFLFFNKNVHEQVSILNRTLINVFSNFIPNKLVTFNDKDPPWMTSDLRDKINWKNSIYKDYLKNGKTNYHYIKLQYECNIRGISSNI